MSCEDFKVIKVVLTCLSPSTEMYTRFDCQSYNFSEMDLKAKADAIKYGQIITSGS